MFFTQETDSGATRIANKGLDSAAGPASGLQDLHESASLLLLVVIVIGGGWLMVKVKEDWSGRLALVLLAAALAWATGMFSRYETVRIDGTFVEDLRGMSFLFDSGFEQVGLGKRLLGATTYRIIIAVHLLASLSMVGAMIAGVRDVVQVPTAAPRRGNANARRL